jgi:hypothetical protein
MMAVRCLAKEGSSDANWARKTFSRTVGKTRVAEWAQKATIARVLQMRRREEQETLWWELERETRGVVSRKEISCSNGKISDFDA